MKDFKCMLAKPLDEKKLSFPCLVSPKLDGIRALYYKRNFYTRNQKQIHGMSHLLEAFKSIPEGIHFDGELLVPGIPFQKSSGLIRSFNEVPNAVFHIFDIPNYDESQYVRIAMMNEILNDLRLKHVTVVPHEIAQSYADITKFYKQFRQQGFEGAMVKNLRGAYENKRSIAWMKMKELDTYDVVCTGFFEGLGRLTGTLGGIIVDLDGVEVRVGGGFSDTDRNHIWANQDKYMGHICEIAGQERTPGGSLRHPRFITWRYDK